MNAIKLASFAILLVAGQVLAQGMPISTDGTDPQTWDPRLDAVIAGVKNHVVIYEDSEIRVLSVTVQPGEVEVAHTVGCCLASTRSSTAVSGSSMWAR